MRLLARREHAVRELAGKLVARGFDQDLVAEELAALADEGLQSDERFAESYTRTRVERGDGPHKIRAALTERGVAPGLIEWALEPYADEWRQRALDLIERRFGVREGGASYAERARRARFLQQRGYTADVVGAVTRAPVAEE